MLSVFVSSVTKQDNPQKLWTDFDEISWISHVWDWTNWLNIEHATHGDYQIWHDKPTGAGEKLSGMDCISIQLVVAPVDHFFLMPLSMLILVWRRATRFCTAIHEEERKFLCSTANHLTGHGARGGEGKLLVYPACKYKLLVFDTELSNLVWWPTEVRERFLCGLLLPAPPHTWDRVVGCIVILGSKHFNEKQTWSVVKWTSVCFRVQLCHASSVTDRCCFYMFCCQWRNWSDVQRYCSRIAQDHSHRWGVIYWAVFKCLTFSLQCALILIVGWQERHPVG